ncbi:MAG: heme exporter protein CcmD [Kordiimonadaceae bacterium]|nr:heme exporter protein CcmD [Kordiimonadaceae bacterium]MBO6568519.1 heme exporter protein CcmD [Kordiimonadaceae bacterium]MBO6963752.1 heme exporter protein CcmD [Kordiimonadaceae bacterium]
MAEFLSMGGYASFVWTAYGTSAAALVWLAVSSRKQLKETNEAVEAARARRRGDS